MKPNPDVLRVDDTTALEALSSNDAKQVVVKGVGIFNWFASGTVDGVNCFDANGHGVWEVQVKDGSSTPWYRLTDAATIAVDLKNGTFQKVDIAADRNISFANLDSARASAVIIRVKHSAGGTKINLPGLSEWDDFWNNGVDEYTLVTGIYDPEDDLWMWDSIILADPDDLPDTDAPTISSIVAVDASHIEVNLNEVVTATNSGWSFDNGAPVVPSAVSGSGTNKLTFTCSGLAAGQTITADYDSSLGDTADASSNELADLTGHAVTNSIAGYQAESIAYFAVNTGLSTAQQNRFDALMIALKGIGLSAFDAMWNFLGNSTSTCKWNALNPLDTDGAFRGTFHGSWTCDGNGVKGGGSGADWLDTHYNPSTHMSSNNGFIGAYIKNSWGDGQAIVGAYDGGSTRANQMTQAGGSHAYWQMGEAGAGPMTSDPAAWSKWCVINRDGSLAADNKGYRDGTNFGQQSTAFTGHVNLDLFIGARNLGGGSLDGASPAQIGLVIIGNRGLTSGERSALKTAVDTWVAGEGRA